MAKSLFGTFDFNNQASVSQTGMISRENLEAAEAAAIPRLLPSAQSRLLSSPVRNYGNVVLSRDPSSPQGILSIVEAISIKSLDTQALQCPRMLETLCNLHLDYAMNHIFEPLIAHLGSQWSEQIELFLVEQKQLQDMWISQCKY